MSNKKDLVFRIKTPHGIVQINNLTNEDKFLDLKTSLIATTGINRLKVLHGYPPKELDLTLEQTKLGNYFKSSRETLIVSENKLGNVKASTQIDDDIQIINTLPPTNTSTILNGYNSKNGRLTRKVVPANNSCLFTAVYFCIRNGTFNAEIGSELRKIIVATVKANPKQFNEGILGCTTEEYCSKIIRDDVWGGSIELKILSDYYAIEIVAVDIQNLRLNRFGEDHNYSSRIFLIYDGIHYDALYFETITKQVVTIFSTKNTELLTLALELAKEANASRQYTDVKNFKLKCLACNEAFVGSKEADQHAKKTSHINFGEF